MNSYSIRILNDTKDTETKIICSSVTTRAARVRKATVVSAKSRPTVDCKSTSKSYNMLEENCV